MLNLPTIDSQDGTFETPLAREQ